jgi:hypothetical protein
MCTAAVAPMQAAVTVQRPWDGGSIRGASAASSALFDLDLEVCCSCLIGCWAALPLQAHRRVCDATRRLTCAYTLHSRSMELPADSLSRLRCRPF